MLIQVAYVVIEGKDNIFSASALFFGDQRLQRAKRFGTIPEPSALHSLFSTKLFRLPIA